MNIQLVIFLLLFVCCSFKCVAANNTITIGIGIGNNTNNIMCVEEDRQALLKFKHAIKIDRCGLLSTWAGDNQNCCHWHGVRCDNITGRVIKLSLRGVLDEYYRDDSYTLDHVRCLEGRVSSSVVDLKHLSYLDLSLNNFTNQPIPSLIGSLVNLKYLNLSDSVFEGEIPHQLGNFLGMFNVSNNNLSGKIPSGSQLQGFDASAYMGNPGLCGLPLAKCSWDQLSSNTSSIDNNMNHHDEKEDDNFILGLCVSVVLGFIVGFWGVCGTLVLKRSWRLAFFRSFDNMRVKARDRVSMIMVRVRRRQ